VSIWLIPTFLFMVLLFFSGVRAIGSASRILLFYHEEESRHCTSITILPPFLSGLEIAFFNPMLSSQFKDSPSLVAPIAAILLIFQSPLAISRPLSGTFSFLPPSIYENSSLLNADSLSRHTVLLLIPPILQYPLSPAIFDTTLDAPAHQ